MRLYTKTILHTNTFRLSLPKSKQHLQANACRHKPLHTCFYKLSYTQTLLYTTKLCANTLYTPTLSHTTSPTLAPRFMRRVAARQIKVVKKEQVVLTLELHFVRKGCRRTDQALKKQNSFSHSNLICAQGRGAMALLPYFLRPEPHCVRKGCHYEIAIVFRTRTYLM